MTSERWIAVKEGWRADQEPIRTAQYFRKEASGASRIVVIVTYQIGGFWAFSTQSDNGYRIHVRSARTIPLPGAPMLPEDVFSVALPRRAVIDFDNIQCDILSHVKVDEPILVSGVPVPYLEGDTPQFHKDPKIFTSDREFPEIIATCNPPSTIDGMTQTDLAVYPITYRPFSRVVSVRTEIKVTIPCLIRSGSYYTIQDVDWGSPVVRNMVGFSNRLLRTAF